MTADPCSLYHGFKRIDENGYNAQVNGCIYSVDNPDEFFNAVWIVFELPRRMTRDEYEFNCQQLNITPLDDAITLKYKFGDFDLGTYFATADLRRQKGIPFKLHQIRACSLVDELDTASSTVAVVAEVTVQEGELWEECRSCGSIPVHMPLHLCRRCCPTT